VTYVQLHDRKLRANGAAEGGLEVKLRGKHLSLVQQMKGGMRV
jgi:hypothetical protein